MTIRNLASHVARVIREHNLFNPGETIIVALSGGADSCALLDILAGMREAGAQLVVAHLNHCLRGVDSDSDEQFCRELSEQYQLPFESRRVNVDNLAQTKRLSLEDAGRRARIAFLNEVRVSRKASAVALAHHADDQAETVLMRLLRGTGARGFSGMSFRTSDGRIRPLLSATRRDIEAYLKKRRLTYREDISNKNTAFLRNRIRCELLPLLATYNPSIRERLVTTAGLITDDNDFLEQLSHEISSKISYISGDHISFSVSSLQAQPGVLRPRLLRQALSTLTGSGDHFYMRHIQAIERLVTAGQPNASINLPCGITAFREYESLHLSKSPIKHNITPLELAIEHPGDYHLPDGFLLTIREISAFPSAPALNPAITVIDLDKAPFPWLVRTFAPGDRIQPIGMKGSKKLKDLFIDMKIPLADRRNIPLIFSGDHLIWICGIRTSGIAAIDNDSKRLVMATYSKQAEIQAT